ncbi:MAG: hypothetical protein KAJ55_14600 [Anaerolineales bacterium]|jgi:hypothetical protein|nr:hypothetical protein [Anaerolineales bacterium]
MSTLDKDYAAGLLDKCDPPCLSLYQPTHRHHPDNQQDPIRFRNLVKELEEPLRQQFPKDDIRTLLQPFLALANDMDFWNHTLDGLAVLGARGIFRVYKLQRPVTEFALVADSFHTKPLMRILQSADRYQVLGLNRQEIRLFEGNRDALDEIELARTVPKTITEALGDELTEPHRTVASYGGIGDGHSPMHHGHGGKESEVDIDAERFFRAIDRGILEHHSKPAGLTLILAALPQYHHLFHQVSHNPLLIEDSIEVHPDSLTIEELRQRAWQILEPHYLARLAKLVEEFGNAKSKGLGDDVLVQVAKAIVAGRVATLMIEAVRKIPGRIDSATGEIEFGDLSHPEVDDVLDDLGELALKKGGQIVIVPAERMPTDTGIAAIYRY